MSYELDINYIIQIKIITFVSCYSYDLFINTNKELCVKCFYLL